MQETAEARILLVGTDLERVRGSQGRLSSAGYAVRVCGADPAAAVQLDQFDPLVVVVDPSVGEASAAEFLERSRRQYPATCFISPDELERAALVEPSSNGPGPPVAVATSAVASGVGTPGEGEPSPDLLQLVERGLERARKQREAARFKNRADAILSQARFDEIIGNHASMQSLLKKVAQVAKTRANVLILGESGTGKELIAASLHQNSKRHAARFIKLNCAALSESVLESLSLAR